MISIRCVITSSQAPRCASWKADKLTSWEAQKLTNWQADKFTSYRQTDDKRTGWQDDKMTRWQDDKMTRWQDDNMTSSQHDKMIRSHDDKTTRWHYDMMRWWDDDMMTWWHDPSSLIMILCLLSHVYRLKCLKSETPCYLLTYSLTRVKSRDASASKNTLYFQVKTAKDGAETSKNKEHRVAKDDKVSPIF